MVKRKIALPRLFEVRLPEGRIPGFDVAFRGDNRQRYELPPGYDGFRFIGAGRDRTHVEAPSSEYHDSSIFVGAFDGPVWFESMTIHGAERKALHAGLANSPKPKGVIRGRDLAFVAERGADGGRPLWGLFTYCVDVDLAESEFFWADGVEHAGYEHGCSSKGSIWLNVDVHGSGAEGSKVRNDNQETIWKKGARIIRKRCKFKSWYQPWSWRGGAGIVLQGTGYDVLIEGCEFWGGPDSKQRCIMIDDGGTRVDGRPDYYSATDGAIGGAFANGFIVIRKCALFSGPGPSWYGTIMRIGNLRGTGHKVSRGVLIEDCGVYGERMLAQLTHSPLAVTGCNTLAIRDACDAIGMNVGAEAMISGNPLVPFSRGKAAAP